MAGLRDKILAANDVESELVEIPEWGVSVEVRSMSLAMRERIGQMASEAEGSARPAPTSTPPSRVGCHRHRLDPETGEALFTADDIAALNNKNAAAVGKLSEVGARLSGLTGRGQGRSGKDASTPSANNRSSSSPNHCTAIVDELPLDPQHIAR